MKNITFLIFAFVVFVLSAQPAFAETPQSPDGIVSSILSAPNDDLSYERAKLALDRIIQPDIDQAAVIAQIDQLAAAAQRIAAGGNDIDKLKAVRQVIYEPGAWNGNRPFVYNHADPYGADLRTKLLTMYLDTRRGNCVSMPILQLIVAERLGLNVSLSTAPQSYVHALHEPPNNGRSIAIESTSGGHPAAEKEYFQKMGVTQRQVDSGIHMSVLTKRDSIAVMANTVTEWLTSQGRYSEAIEVADILLETYPKDVNALLSRGAAYGELLRTEFFERFATPAAIPPDLLPRYEMLTSRTLAAYRLAESWGWVMPDQP